MESRAGGVANSHEKGGEWDADARSPPSTWEDRADQEFESCASWMDSGAHAPPPGCRPAGYCMSQEH